MGARSDGRFTVTPEYAGSSRWVLRFCGDFIKAYSTRAQARAGKVEAVASWEARIADVCADIEVGGIAGIIRAAAFHRLWDGTGGYAQYGFTYTSCVAVAEAYRGADPIGTRGQCERAESFLHDLGASLGPGFMGLPEGEIRQGARFLWLQFAALVAQDEGL